MDPEITSRPARPLNEIASSALLAVHASRRSPADPQAWSRLVGIWRGLLEAARVTSQDLEGDSLTSLSELLRALDGGGLHERLMDALQCAPVAGERRQSLAATILGGPAWRMRSAPAFADVPNGCWGLYAQWVFAAPTLSGPTELAHFAEHLLKRQQELWQWTKRNRGSTAVRAALGTYAGQCSMAPLYPASFPVLAQSELRARLLTAEVCSRSDDFDPPVSPRAGRRLRIGVVASTISERLIDAPRLLARCAHLAPDRFEVTLLVAASDESSAVEAYARGRASAFSVLPADLPARIQFVRAAGFDVLVFEADLTGPRDGIVELALHRCAPLQVATELTPIGTGMPTIDLHVWGEEIAGPADAPAFPERLVLIRDESSSFDLDADSRTAEACRREMLGIPGGAKVFVSAARLACITPEVARTWAKLLRLAPESHLLVHPVGLGSTATDVAEQLSALLDRELAAEGVPADRAHVSNLTFGSRAEMKALVQTGDVYLDAFPYGDPIGVSVALELSLPIVLLGGTVVHHRVSSALLGKMNPQERAPESVDEYVARALRYATDAGACETARAALQEAMGGLARSFDALATSDAWGGLLETVFDELDRVGREQLRTHREPFHCRTDERVEDMLETASCFLEAGLYQDAREQGVRALGIAPNSARARQVVARCLMSTGDFVRAAEYLVGAVQQENSPAIWSDLVVALNRAGRFDDAVVALQAWVRVPAGEVEPWFELASAAAARGHQEILETTIAVLKTLTPNDPRLTQLCRPTPA